VLSALDCYSYLSERITGLKLTGGGAKSGLWPQMLADALGCPVDVDEGGETGAKGAMINAGVALGVYGDYGEARRKTLQSARRIEPTAGLRPRWLELLELYRATYRSMFDIWDKFHQTFGDQGEVG
jgi:sugar (pentulose or hexulose) kinase